MADGEEWPTNCVFFQTIISNTVTGIECDTTRIYDNAHSYPKKPGNVIAAFMYNLAWEEASAQPTPKIVNGGLAVPALHVAPPLLLCSR